MFVSGHPVLLYILIFYSIYFLVKSKSKNEFLLIFTLFMFFIERNSWENQITSLTTSPIRTQPTDIALSLLVIFILNSLLQKKNTLFFSNIIYTLFSIFIFLSFFISLFRFGYPAIAEFRAIFYFIIIMIFISSNIKISEVPDLIKIISAYLMPLILLAPINLVITANFSVNVANRQFGSLMYQSIILGFVAGYFYYKEIDSKFKLPFYLAPILFLMIPYTTHRTTWGSIILMLPFLLYFYNIKKTLIYIVVLLAIPLFFISIDQSFIQERVTAFTDIQEDNTGSWRLLVWNAVIDDASFLGKGIGARFVVYASVIGWDAMYGAHNGFVLILYYLGYLGLLILFIFFIYLTFMLFRKSLKKSKDISLVVSRLGFVSMLSLWAYMMGYGFDVVSIIFISFALIKNPLNPITKY